MSLEIDPNNMTIEQELQLRGEIASLDSEIERLKRSRCEIVILLDTARKRATAP